MTARRRLNCDGSQRSNGRKTMRSKAAASLIAVMFVMAGCAAQSTNSAGDTVGPTMPMMGASSNSSGVPLDKSRPRGFQANPFDPPDQDARVTYDDGLVSYPIATTYVPNIGASKAVQSALAIGHNSDLQPGTPAVVLRSVSIGFSGQDATYSPHPAWLVIWYGSRADLHGPVAKSARARAELVDGLECIYVVVVDAWTGEAQDARQLCRARRR